MHAKTLEKACYTEHAQRRQRQRGIDDAVVEALFEHGAMSHDHRGAVTIYFDRRARQRLANALTGKQLARIECHLNVFAVVGQDGSIVTLGHRTRRIQRH